MTPMGAVDQRDVHMRNRSNQNPVYRADREHHASVTEDDFTQRSATRSSGPHVVRKARNARRNERLRLRHQAAAVEAEIRRLRSTAWPARTRVCSRQTDG